MSDPSEIVANLVAMLRDIPDLVGEMDGDGDRICAYHDRYPNNVSPVHAMPPCPRRPAWPSGKVRHPEALAAWI
jgi:hypothetical protein